MKKTVIQIVDDIDGHDLSVDEAETVRWGLDGRDLEFDASAENAAQFREHVAKYRDLSRPVHQEPRRTRRTRAQTSRTSTSEVRAWANENGYTVSDRGRIPIDVQSAYDAAHG